MNVLQRLAQDLDNMDAFGRNPSARMKQRGGNARATRGGSSLSSRKNNSAVEAAIFDIVVTRLTANIVGVNLPFALFGAQHLQNQYNGIIDSVNGAALTVSAGLIGSAGNQVRFSYLVGGNTDVVTIECTSGAQYPAFLQALVAGKFRINKIRMSLSDSTQLTQLSRGFSYFDFSMFGKQTKNKLPISSFKSPEQLQNAIVDIPFVGEIDAESGFASDIIATAAFSVTYSVFVEKIG